LFIVKQRILLYNKNTINKGTDNIKYEAAMAKNGNSFISFKTIHKTTISFNRLLLLLLGLFFFSSFSLYGAAVLDGGGLLYGGGAGYMLEAPKGWIFDNESGVADGLHCVMYPKGGSWKGSPIAIYANTFADINVDLEHFVMDDIDATKKSFPKMKYKMGAQFKTNKNLTAITVDFAGNGTRYERVVFVYSNNSVCMVVLTTKEPKTLEKYKNVVFEVIKNIYFMNVEDKTGGKN
jgi:hypothetical protein